MKYQIKKSIIINAKTEKIKPLITDFNHWKTWSPWSICEPNHQQIITGNPCEVGHKMSWNGKIIGSGHNAIEKINENYIYYHLEFLKPWKSTAKTRLSLEKTSEGTKVTWTMDSSIPFFLFFMINKMKAWIGMDYERGLKMLKTLAEKGKIETKTTNEGISEFQGFSYIGIQKTSTIKNIGKEMKQAFTELIEELKSQGKSAKHFISIYIKSDIVSQKMTYIAAISDEELKESNLKGNYLKGVIDSGKVLEIKHKGSYEFLGNAWSMGMMFLRAKKIKKKKHPFEYYWNSPYEVKPEELETSIYFPIK